MMISLADCQKFVLWLCGSLTVFGCIASLVAYLIYGDTSCNQSDKECTTKTTVSKKDNDILKVIGPVFIFLGILVIILVRCWQKKTSPRHPATDANVQGERNGGYGGNEFDFGSPPTYTEALGMRNVLEAHGSFPSEPPPKYDEILDENEEEIAAPQNEANENDVLPENRSLNDRDENDERTTNMATSNDDIVTDNDTLVIDASDDVNADVSVTNNNSNFSNARNQPTIENDGDSVADSDDTELHGTEEYIEIHVRNTRSHIFPAYFIQNSYETSNRIGLSGAQDGNENEAGTSGNEIIFTSAVEI